MIVPLSSLSKVHISALGWTAMAPTTANTLKGVFFGYGAGDEWAVTRKAGGPPVKIQHDYRRRRITLIQFVG